MIPRSVDVGQFNFLDATQYTDAIQEVVDSGWYTNHGPQAQALESELANLLHVEHCILVSNATLGLTIAIETVGPVSRIVMPAVSFPSTLWSAQFAGLPVRLIDIDLVTGHVDIDALELNLAKGDLLIVPNLYGGAAKVDEVLHAADALDCKTIFDSAGSLGTTFKNQLLGSFGDCEVFSLHATKIVGAGEGGFISTNNEEVAARARSMRSSYGNSTPVQVGRTANARISEIQAACARRALGQLPAFIHHNRTILSVYHDAFAASEVISGLEVSPGVETNGSSATFVLAGDSEIDVGKLVQGLEGRGVRARRYYNPGLHRLPRKARLELQADTMPNADYLLSHVIQLPVGKRVSPEVASDIAAMVKQELAILG